MALIRRFRFRSTISSPISAAVIGSSPAVGSSKRRISGFQPDNQLQQHALPASAPSQDGYGFTLSDLQVDAVQNPLLAEGLSQVPDLYRRLEPVFFHCFTTPRRSE